MVGAKWPPDRSPVTPVVLFGSYMAQSVIYNLHCRPTRRSWLLQETYVQETYVLKYWCHLHGTVGCVARNPAMIVLQVVLQVDA